MRSKLFVSMLVAVCCAAADFSSYAGDANDSRATAVAVDAAGNTYVTGVRIFPGTNTAPLGLVLGLPVTDLFVTKLDPAGNVLFTTTMSGKDADESRTIAVDPAGNIYIAGATSSENFPLRNALYPRLPRERLRGFVAKLSADGRVAYSTFFPGTVNAITVDSVGNGYVTGQTDTPDFPVTAGLPHGIVTQPGPGRIIGGFITKLSADGSRIVYSTIISGGNVACGSGSSCFLSTRGISGNAIAVDGAGGAYVAGYANVTNLPTTASAPVRQGIGGWVAKINSAGTALDYLTYIGETNRVLGTFGIPANSAAAIAVDSSGNAYVVGRTTDPKLGATAGAFQMIFHGPDQITFQEPPSDGFALKLNPQGTAFMYATYLGGSGEDSATRVAVDSAGNAYVTGTTNSADFPRSTGQGSDFLIRLNGAGAALDYAARFPSGIASRALAVEPSGQIHIASTGAVVSTITPEAPLGARLYGVGNAAGFGVSNAAGGNMSGRVEAGEVISIYGTGLGPARPAGAMLDASGRISTTLSGVRVLFDDLPAPLLYVSDNQINAVAPFGLSGKASADLHVTFGATDTRFRVTMAEATPQVFKNGSAAAALNEDGSVNSRDNPAKAGSIVAIWATGFDPLALYPRPTDGEITTIASNLYPYGEVSVDGKPAFDVPYAGPAPGLVAGITQINFRLPSLVGLPVVIINIKRAKGSGLGSEGASVCVSP